MEPACDFSLRPAVGSDREWIYAVKRAAMKDHIAAVFGWDESIQRRLFDESFDTRGIQIIVLAGKEVGLVQTDDREDHVFLARIELLPETQRKGIGTVVIWRVVEKAESAGKAVRLQVFRSNPAQRLYQRLGFRTYAETATHLKMERMPAIRVNPPR